MFKGDKVALNNFVENVEMNWKKWLYWKLYLLVVDDALRLPRILWCPCVITK